MSGEINRGAARGAIGNRTIGIPFELVVHDREVGHSFVIGPTRDGMTARVAEEISRDARLWKSRS